MIRINLARNRVQETTVQGGSISVENSAAELREALIKIAFILLFVLVLMVYENQMITALNNENAQIQNQISALEPQLLTKQQEVEGIKDFAKQAEELEVKLKVLKTLSRLRLREVKTLDFMQSSIPEKVWVKTIDFNSDKERFESGKFLFTGNSATTEDLTDFVKRLEDSAYMEDVIVVRNQEMQGTAKTGSLRDFQFQAQVESKF